MAIALTDTLGKSTPNVIHKDINPGNIVFNPNTGVSNYWICHSSHQSHVQKLHHLLELLPICRQSKPGG